MTNAKVIVHIPQGYKEVVERKREQLTEAVKRILNEQQLDDDFIVQGLTNFEAVRFMYMKYNLLPQEAELLPQHIKPEDSQFRLRALTEELTELAKAYSNQDLPGIADALVDLVVFALGTAALHGLPWEDLFSEVMRANNDKVLGNNPNKPRSNGQGKDLVKPAGWRGPDIEGVLKAHNWTD